MPTQVEVPGHGLVEFPDGMSDDQIADAIKTNMQPPSENGVLDAVKGVGQKYFDYAKGVNAGALSGAADIGNTLINASSFVPRKVAELGAKTFGVENPLEKLNQEREAGLDSFTEANQDMPGFTTGRIGANVAGTLGVGGALAKGVQGLSQAPAALKVAEALATGGGGTGNLATRTAGGAVTGGVSAGLVDPESAATGAIVGGAIPGVSKVAKAIGGGVADVVGGVGTYTGGESIKQAAKAGFNGGDEAATFTANMRGNVPMTDVLDDAKFNLEQMRKAKAAEYRSGMADISTDKTILQFDGVDNALKEASQVGSFKGQTLNTKAKAALDEITEEVDSWKALDPAEFHTPEGLDALKKKVGGILESIPYEEKTARTVAGGVYKSIKDEIAKQAPTYAKVMKDSSEASDQIFEIERALSLGNKAAVDTAMRKLQSLTRNNVNTNYGNRLELAKALEEQGGRQIMPALAGQSLNSITPRGLGKLTSATAAYAAFLDPTFIPALAATSPRLVGETALKAGQAARKAKAVRPAVGAVAAAMNRD